MTNRSPETEAELAPEPIDGVYHIMVVGGQCFLEFQPETVHDAWELYIVIDGVAWLLQKGRDRFKQARRHTDWLMGEKKYDDYCWCPALGHRGIKLSEVLATDDQMETINARLTKLVHQQARRERFQRTWWGRRWYSKH